MVEHAMEFWFVMLLSVFVTTYDNLVLAVAKILGHVVLLVLSILYIIIWIHPSI